MHNNPVCKFEKVPFEQFEKDFNQHCSKSSISAKEVYDKIELPARGTKRASGYDFKYPIDIVVDRYGVVIPSGIRVVFNEDGYDLRCMPRSGLGFKHGIALSNTIAIIDNDYSDSDNYGHILFKLVNNGLNPEVTIPANKGYIQGIICRYYLAEEEEVMTDRNGGFGSTGM